MHVMEDREEYGKRLAAARGYMGMKKTEFATFMGVSVSTVIRWEDGDLGKKSNNPSGRRQFAWEMSRKTGCPPEILGLRGIANAEEEAGEDVPSEAERQIAAVRALLKTEIAKVRKDLGDLQRLQSPPGRSQEGSSN